MATKRGFTLVELLVVIAIIAMLMGILMPALSRARQLAYRLTCGTNLSGIGKAMMVYAHDNDGKLPRSGSLTSTWGPVKLWSAPDRRSAFGIAMADGSGVPATVPCSCGCGGISSSDTASITSCFYLLVKYAEVTPKSFVCKGDAQTREFRLADQPSGTVPAGVELTDVWDFGPVAEASTHCSYSYHVPFGRYALTTLNEPGLAVAADRNPWIRSPAGGPATWSDFRPDTTGPGVSAPGSAEQARRGNARAHQNDGQNVLFLDSHVEFAKRSFCAIEDDNIYTVSRDAVRGDLWGTPPQVSSTLAPANRADSVLVHDPDSFSSSSVGHL
jgi:prepilin-type N-terminal cleavage/methylation domain-containing protein/prepilin-type processing-associated H-X9-DG protein